MRRTRAGWALTVEVPGERLRLLRQCAHVRIRAAQGVWWGRIVGVNGQLTPEGRGVLAQVEVRQEDAPCPPIDLSRPVRLALIRERDVPLLSALLNGILNLQKGRTGTWAGVVAGGSP
jgi:hypothetical protein